MPKAYKDTKKISHLQILRDFFSIYDNNLSYLCNDGLFLLAHSSYQSREKALISGNKMNEKYIYIVYI